MLGLDEVVGVGLGVSEAGLGGLPELHAARTAMLIAPTNARPAHE
ncbi:hypothetical protein UO65_0134 [Actinokineospora spheciospongiae]|uniref:Uncharacterized protein n=1 Tax=Actinokineospora spheciospongiae TaxID=909613 RepID=W7J688_9PSEU|nr:hypothetical protein UO65_0134 [Actinokineospora spheciospongiae]